MIFQLLEKILDQCLKINKFQDYVNRHFSIKCGIKWVYNSNNTTIEEVFKEYKFNDIREDDIVLDIGANVGGFSLFISKMVKHVYSVEPFITTTLNENINLNNLNNITVFDEALGIGDVEVVWGPPPYKSVKGKSLSELIALCGGHVDILKCDCEGGEWCITSDELKNIRRIEMEVHNLSGNHNFNDYFKKLDQAGFEYTYNIYKETDMLVHAKSKMII